ncbi:MAG: hypothetical protein ACOYBP_05440 [Microbacteriaceae bacterium]
MSNQRIVRVVRALAAASTATAVALIGHLLGGGELPSLLGVAVPLLVSALIAIPLIGRKLALWRTTIVVLLSQLLFHWLFVLGSTGSATTMSAEMPGMQHSMAGSVAVSAHTMAMPAMSLGHFAAAVFTIALLYHGERVLRGLLELTLGFIRTVCALLAVPALTPLQAQPTTPVFGRHTRLLASTLSRRGPPARF